jgi:large-conductance mechanosensitive channel
MGGVENQVLVFALAIHLGSVLSSFFHAITRDLVLPLLSPLASAEDGVSKLVIQIGGVKFNFGDAVVQTINLLIACLVVYITLPYVKEYIPVAGRR